MARETVVTEEHVLEICEDIGTCWHDLGIKLKLQREILLNINADYSLCREKAREMLYKWMNREGSSATVGSLADALKDIGNKRVAQKLLEKEELKTEISNARRNSAKLQEEVSSVCLEKEQQTHKKTLEKFEEVKKSLYELLMAKDEDDKEVMETRVQQLNTTIKELEEKLLTEKSEKEFYVKEATRLQNLCYEMDNDLGILKERFEKISKDDKDSNETLPDYNNNVLNETTCREIMFEGKEEMKTELNRARTHSAKLREKVHLMKAGLEEEQQIDERTQEKLEKVMKSLYELLMTKDKDNNIETRVLALEATIKGLEEELSTEKCDKKNLDRICDQMNENSNSLKESFEKISEEHKKLVESLSDYRNNVFNESSCSEEEMRLISPREEIVVVNAFKRDNTISSLKRPKNPWLHDKATSTEELTGNQTCVWCHELEEERDALQAEMDSKQNEFKQLELEHNKTRQTLEEDIKDREMKIIELDEFYNQLNVLHLKQKNELEQIKTLMKEENERKVKLGREKEEIEKELENTKAKLVDQKELEVRRVEAVNSRENFKKINEKYWQRIKKLKQKNKTLGEKNEDLLKEIETTSHKAEECDKLRAERDQLNSKIDRLVQEAAESRLKCRKLEEELLKCRNFVSHVFLPSGKEFHSSPGVICALGRDISAKLVATRSSDLEGEASDIFDHKKGKDSGTDAVEGSWWCVDLGKNYLLVITHCALRHGKMYNESILTKWQFQGSADGVTWKNLERENPSDPPQFRDPPTYSTGIWTVKGEVGAFRYFRILQTGRNSSGKYGIYLSGVELYGVLSKV
ncbi:uncharacterized protein LOC144661514 isoform X2 [Oculina patagonica]